MQFKETGIQDLILIEPKIHRDNRGYFYESFNQKNWNENVGDTNFVQDNQAKSSLGILRGLHFQNTPHPQGKLVRVIKGTVQDVAIDLRKNSPTFGKYFSVILTEDNFLQLYIPTGFAHAYLCLSEEVVFAYKVTEFYHPECDAGIIYNDPEINIEWELPENQMILSEKDKNLPNLSEIKDKLEF